MDGARRPEEVDSILSNENISFEERVKLAEEVAKLVDEGSYATKRYVSLFLDFLRLDIDTLYKEKDEYYDEIERIIANGVYNYRVNKLRKEYMKYDITQLAKTYAASQSMVERMVIEDIVKSRKEEIESIPEQFYRMSLLMLIGEVRDIRDAIKKTVDDMMETFKKFTPIEPNIPSFTESYISTIGRPAKSFAKMCFRSGIWKMKWGDPAEYGIDVESELRFVDDFSRSEFRQMLKHFYNLDIK